MWYRLVVFVNVCGVDGKTRIPLRHNRMDRFKMIHMFLTRTSKSNFFSSGT
jgi:hypothetical protein